MKYVSCRVYLVIILIFPVLILPSAHSICPTYYYLDTFLLLAHKWKSDNLILDLKINGQLTTCFIPYVDLLKAGEVDESSWKYDDQKKGFVLTSITEIKRG